MSVRLMSKLWELDMPCHHKLLLLALADWAADDGTRIYPSVETMVRKSRIPERSVQRYLATFREIGLLVLVEAATHHKPAHYRIDCAVVDAMLAEQERGATVAPQEPRFEGCQPDSGVPNPAVRGAKNDGQGCHSLAPNPLVEPLGNHQTHTPDGFDAFWLAFPRKDGKQAARKEWCKLRPTPQLRDTLMAALQRQKAAKRWWVDRDGRPAGLHASTWLHQMRWEDEVQRAALPKQVGVGADVPTPEQTRQMLREKFG